MPTRVDVTSRSLADRLWHALGAQLRQPDGMLGVLVGRLMVLANAGPYRHALAALDILPGDRVLEVGFGPGAALGAIVDRGAVQVCGLEPSNPLIAAARRRFSQLIASGRMDLVQGALPRMPWAQATFDRILLVNVLYFLDPERGDLAVLRRALRPGGRLVIYATDRDTMRRWPFAGTASHRTYTARECEAALVDAGFDDRAIHIQTMTFPFGVTGFLVRART
ncbi:class I SAM-dependent methyltransferase [Methylobacterium fujisawaense]|uniref:class I SAM-dependent methyltransferase n=1 Tax=Methylobacterium fujisawaense TaxID=107400 RepID=UPI00313D0DC8